LGLAYLTPGVLGRLPRFDRDLPWQVQRLGTFVAVYFLVTGITGLELLGCSGWISDVFYGASLVLAINLLPPSRPVPGAPFVTESRASLRADPRQQPTEVFEAMTSTSLAGEGSGGDGWSRGIGRAIATALAVEGADVAIIDLAPACAGTAVAEVESHGRRGLAVEADIAEISRLSAVFSSRSSRISADSTSS